MSEPKCLPLSRGSKTVTIDDEVHTGYFALTPGGVRLFACGHCGRVWAKMFGSEFELPAWTDRKDTTGNFGDFFP